MAGPIKGELLSSSNAYKLNKLGSANKTDGSARKYDSFFYFLFRKMSMLYLQRLLLPGAMRAKSFA